jgi:drug/metabolite transporter (DMT)-like permease
MATMSDNTRGALLMTGSMAAFTFNDAFMKALGEHLPLFQAIFLRGIGVTVFLIGLTLWMGQLSLSSSRRDWWLMSIRAVSEMGGAWFFITALFHMPFANLSAILQALPLAVTLAGALFLRESVGWRRMAAILIGFVGVMLIVRPGAEGFTIYALYGLATVVCVTVRDLVSRMMSRSVPSLMVASVSALGVTLFAAAGSTLETWAPVTGIVVLKLLGATVFVFGGYLFSVSAMRVGDLAFVAPFRYTSLLVALVVGALVFRTFPDTLTLIGAAIVVATGLFTLYRERVTRRAALAAAAASHPETRDSAGC